MAIGDTFEIEGVEYVITGVGKFRRNHKFTNRTVQEKLEFQTEKEQILDACSEGEASLGENLKSCVEPPGEYLRKAKRYSEQATFAVKVEEIIKKSAQEVIGRLKLDTRRKSRRIIKLQKELIGYEQALTSLQDNSKLHTECQKRINRLREDLRALGDCA